MSNKKNIKFDGESFPGHKPFAKIWSQDYGINSDVFLYKYFDSNKKSVMIKFGARKGGFKLENAIEMTNDILLYQDELEKRLIPLPPIEKMNLEYNPVTHKIEIIKTSTWTGSDIGKIIKLSNINKNIIDGLKVKNIQLIKK